MLYTGYFDEADTHGPAPTIIMAGFLGSRAQWELFGRRLRSLQRRDGFSVFHGNDFKGKSGEFSGWPNPKCMKLVEDLTTLVRDHLTEGLTVHLERERYLNEYRAPPVPKKMTLDSQYGVCFRACMRQVMEILWRDGKRHRLDVVIEDGHNNVGDCERIFKVLKRRLERRNSAVLLGKISIAKKTEAAPLMLADFLASSYSMMRTSARSGGPDYVAEAPEPPKWQAGLTFLELLPGALTQLKADFEADRQARVEAWRAARQKSAADDLGLVSREKAPYCRALRVSAVRATQHAPLGRQR